MTDKLSQAQDKVSTAGYTTETMLMNMLEQFAKDYKIEKEKVATFHLELFEYIIALYIL